VWDVKPEDITVDYAKSPISLFLEVIYAYNAQVAGDRLYRLSRRLHQVGSGVINLALTLQKLLDRPFWNPVSNSYFTPAHANCEKILGRLSDQHQKMELVDGSRIAKIGDIITSNDHIDSHHLPHSYREIDMLHSPSDVRESKTIDLDPAADDLHSNDTGEQPSFLMHHHWMMTRASL
jgi:hypothetical protein